MLEVIKMKDLNLVINLNSMDRTKERTINHTV